MTVKDMIEKLSKCAPNARVEFELAEGDALIAIEPTAMGASPGLVLITLSPYSGEEAQ